MEPLESENLFSRAGFVSVMGRSNVGKSTLINALIGQKIAAVSPKPQTTRKKQLGILTIGLENHFNQIVFIDTPGIHQPLHKLGEMMNREAQATLEHCDAILLVVDITQKPDGDDLLIFNTLESLKRTVPVVMALNKIDLLDERDFSAQRELYKQKIPSAIDVAVSAKNGVNLEKLIAQLVQLLPEGDLYFPEHQITDLFEREIAADLIREATLNKLSHEVPHGVAVRIDEFKERNEKGAYIHATLFVERDSHKPILIGKDGRMIKEIGTAARQEIEAITGRKVFLKLNVKVRKKWRDDAKVLRYFGF